MRTLKMSDGELTVNVMIATFHVDASAFLAERLPEVRDHF
jgi:hypothetical protein